MSEQEDQYWEKIDDFLDGSMSPDEQTAFSSQVEKEEQLKKDVNLQQQLRQGIAYGSQLDLRSRLAGIHQEYQQSKDIQEGKVIPLNRGMWTRWAAAAAMIIGALTILFLIQSDPTGPELFASNYEAYALKSTTRSPGQDDITDLAVQAYQAGDYDIAIARLQAALETDSEHAPLQLALAVSLWETGQTEEAIAALDPILDHPLLQDQANWYGALFQLAQDNTAAAKGHLEVVQQSGGMLKEKADVLLEQLK